MKKGISDRYAIHENLKVMHLSLFILTVNFWPKKLSAIKEDMKIKISQN